MPNEDDWSEEQERQLCALQDAYDESRGCDITLANEIDMLLALKRRAADR